jgi:hypothetical protein
MTAADLYPMGGGTVTVAVYNDYATAQRAVDFLSDNKFPVHEITIVGEDIKLLEHVLGRMTIVRAAAAGALSGAWFGLLIRDFRSVSTLQAARYGLRVPAEQADAARQLLANLDAQTTGTSPT